MNTVELISLWMVGHILFLFIFSSKLVKNLALLFAICIFLFLFNEKPDTYDLNWYLPFFAAPYTRVPAEFGFYYISLLNVELFNLTAKQSLFFWQFFIFIFFAQACRNFGSKNILIIAATILASVMYVLSSQGAIRQGVSLSLVFFALSLSYSRKSKYLSVIIGGGALIFHVSGVQFYILGRILMWLSLGREISFSYWLKRCWFMFALGVVAFLYMAGNETYGIEGFEGGEARTSSGLKLIAIAISFIITELILAQSIPGGSASFLRKIRLLYLIFLIPVSVAPEGFSRLAYFYYAIEMILVSCLLCDRSRQRNLIAALFILLTYAVAPNAINIITGLGQPPGAYDNSY